MFINFTNHPSTKWSQEQRDAASVYGEVYDMQFPEVDPDGDEGYIRELAGKYADEIINYRPAAVICQGEMSLVFAVAKMLIERGVTTLAACSKREVRESVGEDGETMKYAEFRFVRFRRYME